MRRGATPILTLQVPQLSLSRMRKVELTLSQDGERIVITGDRITIKGDHTITVKLTQEETLKFRAGRSVSVQGKFMGADGTVIPSKIGRIPCKEILNAEVMTNE